METNEGALLLLSLIINFYHQLTFNFQKEKKYESLSQKLAPTLRYGVILCLLDYSSCLSNNYYSNRIAIANYASQNNTETHAHIYNFWNLSIKL